MNIFGLLGVAVASLSMSLGSSSRTSFPPRNTTFTADNQGVLGTFTIDDFQYGFLDTRYQDLSVNESSTYARLLYFEYDTSESVYKSHGQRFTSLSSTYDFIDGLTTFALGYVDYFDYTKLDNGYIYISNVSRYFFQRYDALQFHS